MAGKESYLMGGKDPYGRQGPTSANLRLFRISCPSQDSYYFVEKEVASVYHFSHNIVYSK